VSSTFQVSLFSNFFSFKDDKTDKSALYYEPALKLENKLKYNESFSEDTSSFKNAYHEENVNRKKSEEKRKSNLESFKEELKKYA